MVVVVVIVVVKGAVRQLGKKKQREKESGLAKDYHAQLEAESPSSGWRRM